MCPCIRGVPLYARCPRDMLPLSYNVILIRFAPYVFSSTFFSASFEVRLVMTVTNQRFVAYAACPLAMSCPLLRERIPERLVQVFQEISECTGPPRLSFREGQGVHFLGTQP